MRSIFLFCLLVNYCWCGSWDGYIDNLLGHTSGAADEAAIIGMDGSLWTSWGHASALKVSPDEATKISEAFMSGDMTEFQSNGIVVEGIKYIFLRTDDESKLALGKKKDHGAITLQASKSAIVIGHTKEGQSQGNTNKGVAVIAEYLESLGL